MESYDKWNLWQNSGDDDCDGGEDGGDGGDGNDDGDNITWNHHTIFLTWSHLTIFLLAFTSSVSGLNSFSHYILFLFLFTPEALLPPLSPFGDYSS